ncbi:MAG TPA: GntR family transcriptional regulator, partial [Streptosporangiaceae bacterium]|nr:GntR family transcriptional regulator [Streptosporangiaceae bacterium]
MGFDYAPPKYAQVVAEIKSRIERGQYPPGSLLPSEHQLVTDFGVSRPTIVKALSALRHDGWIDTQQGRGSFVRGRPALAGAERTRPAQAVLEVPEVSLSGELV